MEVGWLVDWVRGWDRPANDPPGEIFPLVHIVIPPLLVVGGDGG